MSEVKPIKTKKQIKMMSDYLKLKGDKYYILFVLGIQTGLRISDILPLKASDIYNMRTKKVIETKTLKRRYLYLNERTYKEVVSYIEENKLESYEYLIPSRNYDKNGEQKPITRIQAYRILNEAAVYANFSGCGTHTLRKTFGYHYYKKTRNIAVLMRIFNHSSESITLKYIGMDQEEIESSLEDFILF